MFEGNGISTFAVREARVAMLIWLDMPLSLSLFRVIRHNLRQRGQSRTDREDGCAEWLDKLPEFISFFLLTRRSSRLKQRKMFEAEWSEKRHLRRRRDVDLLVDSP